MAIFVTLSEGPESADAVPFLVVDDATVAREVATIIARRLGLGVAARNQQPVVRVIRSPSEPDDGGMP